MIYTKKQIISASMVDTKANLSVIGAFQVIQDAITELTGQLKIDGMTLNEKYNAFWVFAKTRVKFLKEIAWNNEIAISSYISFISLAKMNIDVEIKNKNDEVVIYSRTEICALDMETQRIRKLSTVGVDETMLSDKQTMEIIFTKFEGNDLPQIDNVKIKYTNIDFSHHTNNLEYIRFIMNTYSVAEIERKQIKEMEVIYANQSFENDVLDIFKANFADKDLIVIEKSEKPVIKCEIIF